MDLATVVNIPSFSPFYFPLSSTIHSGPRDFHSFCCLTFQTLLKDGRTFFVLFVAGSTNAKNQNEQRRMSAPFTKS